MHCLVCALRILIDIVAHMCYNKDPGIIPGKKERSPALQGRKEHTMKTLSQYPIEMDAKLKYDLMRSPKMQKISMCKGQILDVDAYVLREDENAEGEITEVLSFRTPEGELFATNSGTFIREFKAILECTQPEFSVEVIDGVSRAGRHFVTCAWVTK